MKKLLLITSLITSLFTVSIANSLALASSKVTKFANTKSIDDGWYSAIVKYNNPNTYTTSKYRLNVKVQYNQVTAIDFGNGGSIHSGFNNEGYIYGGGVLNTDYDGNMTTTVSLSQGTRLIYYNIILE